MIVQHKVTSENWTQITEAGDRGTCWIEEVTKGKGWLRVYHSNSGVPDGSVIRHGYPVRNPEINFDSVNLDPDDANDIYYAIADKPGTEFLLTVDSRSN